MEKLGLQEDLTVGDGDHVGGNVRGNVSRLGLDDGKSGHGAAAVGVIQFCSSLQQSGMKVENVTRISLTAGRTADQKRKSTVSHRMLTQIIVDDEHVLSFIHEIFAHGTAGVGRNVLQRAGLGSSSRYNGGVVHGAVFGEIFHKGGHGGTFLADGDVDADHVFALLVDDGVRSDGGFTGLTVADDELTLAAADGDHGVDGLDTGLEGFMNGTPFTDTRGRAFNGAVLVCHDGACAVDGLSQCVDDTANEGVADGNGNDFSGSLDALAFADLLTVSEQYDGDAVFFQVLRHAVASVFKFQKLASHTVDKTAGPGDTIAHHQDGSGLVLVDGVIIIFDLAADDLGYFFRF